jgi:hypothetical protein
MKTRMVILLLAALFLVGFQGPDKAPENDSILEDDLRADLFFLASDAMNGRRTDTPENRLAAEYLASRFRRMGLRPASGSSFFHNYNLMTSTLGDENLLQVLEGENAIQRLRPGQDYYPLNFSGSGRVQGSVVFAGFGIVAPEHSYDDFRGDAVRGKIVLIVDHEPGERDPDSPFDGVVRAEASNSLRKALSAQANGALAVLFVQDVHNHSGGNFLGTANNYWRERRFPRYTLAEWMESVRIPAAQISPALAEQLLAGTGHTLWELSAASESEAGTSPVVIEGPEVELTTSINRRPIPDRNVIGMLEGSDPDMKDEFVIICAHYDHDGADGTTVFAGADDDGSGTVGLIEIAEAYAAAASAGQRPRRSILFAAWNSEERGLLGAWAYTLRPSVPLDQTVAVLNMDMIGRNEEVPIGGGGRFRGLEVQTAASNANSINILGTTFSDDMKEMVEQANRGIGLDLKMTYDNNASNLMRRSDQWPFLQNGVPALFFHTGLHPDYHTPNDTPEKINYSKMEKIVRVVHQMSWDLAQQGPRPELIKGPVRFNQ